MRKSYTVAEGYELNYPADLVSQQIINSAGGRSKLSAADKLKVKYKTVVGGQDCSDIPANVLQLYLDRGMVIEKIVNESPKPPVVPVISEEGDN